jgi:hypothetical protein
MGAGHPFSERFRPNKAAGTHSERTQQICPHVLVKVGCADTVSFLVFAADRRIDMAGQPGHSGLQIVVTLTGVKPLLTAGEVHFQGLTWRAPVG